MTGTWTGVGAGLDKRSDTDAMLPTPQLPGLPLLLPPLECVAVVTRTRPEFEGLPELVSRISEFVDTSMQLRFSDVLTCNTSIPLLRRIHAHQAAANTPIDSHYRDWQFQHGVMRAAVHGNVEVVKWFCTEFAPRKSVIEGVEVAVRRGNLNVLQWLHNEHKLMRIDDDLVLIALNRDHHMPWRCRPGVSIDSGPIANRLEVVRWLVETFGPGTSSQRIRRKTSADFVFGTLDLEFLQWAVEKNLFRSGGEELTCAAREGRLDVVRWLSSHLDAEYRRQNADGKQDTANLSNDDETTMRWRETWSNGGDRSGSGDRFEDDLDVEGNTVDVYSFPYTVNLNIALSKGHLDPIKWMQSANYEWLGFRADARAMDHAAKTDNLEVLQWLHDNHIEGWSPTAMDHAALQGHLRVVRWLHEHRTEGCTSEAMDTAAMYGHLEVVRWLHENRTEGCTADAMDFAAANNHFDVVVWLLEHRTEGCTAKTMEWAAYHGHLSVIQLLGEAQSVGCTTQVMDRAAANGHLDIVKWLHEHRTEGCTTKAMDQAAANGHMEVVRFLHENRHEGCTTGAMDRAIDNDHMEVFRWLRQHRTEGCSSSPAEHAASDGNLTKIKWLSEDVGAPFSPQVMDRAAANGRLDVVEWLHIHRSEGCTTDAMDKAAWYGKLDIVKWLHANRTEGCTTAAMDNAAWFGKMDTVKWLHANRTEGCTTSAMDHAAENGRLDIVQWLHFNRSEGCTTHAMDEAALKGHFEILLFLHRCRTEGCSAEAFRNACSWYKVDILRWLSQHYPSKLDRQWLSDQRRLVRVDYMKEWADDA